MTGVDLLLLKRHTFDYTSSGTFINPKKTHSKTYLSATSCLPAPSPTENLGMRFIRVPAGAHTFQTPGASARALASKSYVHAERIHTLVRTHARTMGGAADAAAAFTSLHIVGILSAPAT